MPAPCSNCGQDGCRFCYLAAHDSRYAELYGTVSTAFRPGDCIYRGEEAGLSSCASCNGSVKIKTFGCSKHGKCSLEKDVGERVCKKCPDRQPFPLHAALGWHDLGITLPPQQRKFNPALIRYQGQLIMATRIHTLTGWSKGQIWISHLSNDFKTATHSKQLQINHPLAEMGAEDPRLWVYRGQLHISFTGVQDVYGQPVTHVLYGRLNGNLDIEEIYAPHYRERQHWEKNWGFFSSGDELYAVYQIGTHKILKIAGNTATLAYESKVSGWPKCMGEPRGGSSPVKRGNEWYCFLHDVLDRERREYKIYLYTFEDSPPFRVNRIGRVPLFTSDKKHRPNDWTPDVIFPGSAFLENNIWHVAAGYYDHWSWLLKFDVNGLERLLDLAPGGRDSAIQLRDRWDWDIWQNVYNQNEYDLPESLNGLAIVDIGGHIGSFAKLCLDRGAAHVLSIEPSRGNAEIYRKNMHEGRLALPKSLPRCEDLPIFPEDERFYPDGDGGRTIYYPWLRWLVDRYNPQTIAEIGVYRGLSARAMASSARSYVGFDNESLVPMPKIIGYQQAKTYSVDTQTLASIKQFCQHPIDLFHVDGNHTFAGCFHDLQLAFEVLSPNGVIVADDCFAGSEPLAACRKLSEENGLDLLLMDKAATMTGKAILARPKWTLLEGAAFGKPPASASLIGVGCGCQVRTDGQGDPVQPIDLGPVECDLLKMDIEGGEYEIVANADLSRVRNIVGEGHIFPGLPGMEWMKEKLEALGYKVKIKATGPGTFGFWAERSRNEESESAPLNSAARAERSSPIFDLGGAKW